MIHIINEPLSEYIHYEIDAYIESQAAGEQIRLVPQSTTNDQLATLNKDFWLFDEGRENAYGIAMNYATDGSLHGFDLVTDQATLKEYAAAKQIAWDASIPLNEYLARAAVTAERE